jgi:hypothetical protein
MLMFRLDDHADALWPQRLGDGTGNLRRHALLDWEPAGIGLDHARELADAD